ncbi:unnamed protein product, partial [Effrenium voratum]
PIAFLATLMFAPVSSTMELLDLPEDCPWAVTKQTLQKEPWRATRRSAKPSSPRASK